MILKDDEPEYTFTKEQYVSYRAEKDLIPFAPNPKREEEVKLLDYDAQRAAIITILGRHKVEYETVLHDNRVSRGISTEVNDEVWDKLEEIRERLENAL